MERRPRRDRRLMPARPAHETDASLPARVVAAGAAAELVRPAALREVSAAGGLVREYCLELRKGLGETGGSRGNVSSLSRRRQPVKRQRLPVMDHAGRGI